MKRVFLTYYVGKYEIWNSRQVLIDHDEQIEELRQEYEKKNNFPIGFVELKVARIDEMGPN